MIGPGTQLKVGEPIYFGRSVMEFVGRVTQVFEDRVVVCGVETGCNEEPSERVIRFLEGITPLSEHAYAEYVDREPGFKCENCKG